MRLPRSAGWEGREERVPDSPDFGVLGLWVTYISNFQRGLVLVLVSLHFFVLFLFLVEFCSSPCKKN